MESEGLRTDRGRVSRGRPQPEVPHAGNTTSPRESRLPPRPPATEHYLGIERLLRQEAILEHTAELDHFPMGGLREVLRRFRVGGVLLTDPREAVLGAAAVVCTHQGLDCTAYRFEELSPLEVTLELKGKEDAAIPVTLESRVTEVGTLELWCVGRSRRERWKLELNIRERDV